MESASKAIATLRITASDMLKATSSFVDDPPGGEVDVGIGVLTASGGSSTGGDATSTSRSEMRQPRIFGRNDRWKRPSEHRE